MHYALNIVCHWLCLTTVTSAGIRVNAVRPGIVATNIHGPGMTPDKVDGFAANKQLMKRAGRAPEVAKLAVFLLSDDASFMTASLHDCDGSFSVVAN